HPVLISLLQRVSEARVEVSGKVVAEIERGLLVLVGIQPEDDRTIAAGQLARILNYRIFSDVDDKMNLSLVDVRGGLLLVPQFTLAANTRKGRRPSFTSAATPAHGEEIFSDLVSIAREQFESVEAGQFGADMQVQLVNDGPVTFILES
ncbi:MAG: D-tyrosyl-tRNA(Tyr) deacylase, partial [Gammaproteobacteria bacterium]